MISPPEWRRIALLTAVVIGLLALPYLYAFANVPVGLTFAGLLFNPVDGQTYLAKMTAGFRGEWTFRLPYTAQPGPGAWIYGYYLLLGHVARWTGLPMLVVYHAARLAGAAAMMAAAYRLIARLFDSPRDRVAAWIFVIVGSGFGWLAALLGGFTPDLWVAEAFPFLSAHANPHFPLALAAMSALFLAILNSGPRPSWTHGLYIALPTAALAILQPLVLLVVGTVLAAWGVWEVLARQPDRGARSAQRTSDPILEWLICLWPLGVFGAVAVPWLGYIYWVTSVHPALSAWSAQNVTPSPPVWEYLIAFGPALLLAPFGVRAALGRGSPANRLVLAWAAVTALALYAPVPFQRRLSMGLFIPLAILAVMGLQAIAGSNARRMWLATAALLIVSLPTNLLVLLAGSQAPRQATWPTHLTDGEAAALDWLRQNAPQEALVLAGPEIGLFIPARAGQRVLYGHPFETVHAEARRAEVERFFSAEVAQTEAEAYLRENRVDYVFVGPREQAAGALLPVSGLRAEYARDGVAIYSVAP